MADAARERPQGLWLGLAGVLLVTGLAFQGVGALDFVTLDDPRYVTQNRTVLQGLTAEGLAYAFTSLELANWHPLTWLSHMAVAELFGAEPGPHHVANLLLHLANAGLFFLLLFRLTGRAGPAAVAAALFGVHPLHVESVAWVAERKDVLSTLFWLLACLAYAGWARRGARGLPWLATGMLAAGLMAKPMLVTLPFALLLLDAWPLGRWRLADGLRGLGPLVREKAPLFALVVVFSVVTFLVQRTEGAVGDATEFPLPVRLGNAVLAYGAYVQKTLVPTDLVVFYPYPADLPVVRLVVTAVLLVAATAAAWRWRARAPEAFVGWAWFVGTLVPVIGLVQVGQQAHADRYVYVPHLGLFAGGAYLVANLLARAVRSEGARSGAGVLASVLVVMPCAHMTRRQVRVWTDSERLWSHALEVTGDNYLAHDFYGRELARAGRYAEALEHHEAAIALAPEEPNPWINRGNALQARGRLDEAEASYRRAAELLPDYASIHTNLGAVLAQQGRYEEAMAALDRARELDEDDLFAHFNAMLTLLAMRDLPAAAESARRVLEIDPTPLARHARTLDLARILATDPDPALRDGELAVRLASVASAGAGHASFRALEVLAAALAESGRFPEAVEAARRAEGLARREGNGSAAARLRALVEAFQAGRPVRASRSSS